MRERAEGFGWFLGREQKYAKRTRGVYTILAPRFRRKLVGLWPFKIQFAYD